MLRKYLKQKVSWSKTIGFTDTNNPIPSDKKTIPARVEKKIKLVKDKHGSEVVSTTTIWVVDAVSVDDLIDDKQVIAVQDMVKRNGTIEGFEVFT